MKAVKAAALITVTVAAFATAADWTEYRIGPLYVISDAGDSAARQRLTEMEQIRTVLGGMLGIGGLGATGASNAEVVANWPITLVLFDKQRDFAPYAPVFGTAQFIPGGAVNLSAASSDAAPRPEWRAQLTRQLIDANVPLLPGQTATALSDLFSTILVDTVHVDLGSPLPASITGERRRNWARLHMLATRPEYAGRFRVYLRNLQGGDAQLAARNSYAVDAAELERRMNAYADAGKFVAVSVPGKAINSRSFYERRLPEKEVQSVLGELRAAGKSFPPESPRGLMAQNTRESLQQAIAANPRWAEPYLKLAELERRASARVPYLQKAAELEPQNVAYWELLARTQSTVDLYAEASKSWTAAEKASATEEDRVRIRAERKTIEDQRVEAELAAAKLAKEESEREVKRVIEESDARIRAAERAVNNTNRATSGPASGEAPVAFNDGFKGMRVTGQLTAVECIGTSLRLTIQLFNAPPARVLVGAMPMDGTGNPAFACGAVLPPRRIEVVHNAKVNEKLGTIGDVDTYVLR